MKLVIRHHRGEQMWFAEFDNYAPFLIGRVRKMPTPAHAMQIVKAWKLRVIDGRPYHLDTLRRVWVAYGT